MQLIFIGILLLVFGYQQVELSHVAAHSKQPDPDLCVGCIHDVDPQTEPGIDALIYVALKHVESEKTVHYRLIEILRLQEQVQG
ncbi:unnamed protein product [Callosobruchus maculatus]|uniref:Cystatin domain-containing protein n=1 Tax=Callosobruchus maculatus TaxID=64391 RepID=A0A653CHI3_CALMS|nr:unnamed protein product [Callosobruchus maculatus]